MEVFKSRIKHNRLSYTIIALYPVILYVLVIYLLRNQGFVKNHLDIHGIVTCLGIIRMFFIKMNKIYVDSLTVDVFQRKLFFECFVFLKGKKEYERRFDEIKVDITNENLSFFRKSPVIYFYKKRPGEMYLSAFKDKFTKQTLEELSALLTSITHLSINK